MPRKGSSVYSQSTKGVRRRKSSIVTHIQDLMACADREICLEYDEFAYRRGWTVARAGFGCRLYRDPRFDQLRIPPRVTEEVS